MAGGVRRQYRARAPRPRAPAPAPLVTGGVGTKLQQLRLARWGHGPKISGHGRKNIWIFDHYEYISSGELMWALATSIETVAGSDKNKAS